MEQRKILWVMMSVSLLLVVLLGMGMFLPYFSRGSLPRVEGSEETAQTAETRFDAIEYIRKGDIAGVEEAEPVEEDFIAVADELVIGESEEAEAETSAGETREAEPLGEAPPSTAPPVERLASSQPTSGQPALNSPVPSQTAPSRPPASQRASRVQVRTPTPKPAPVKTTVIEYWIQVGSFTKSSQAEENKEKLAAQGVNSVIRTKTVGGTTYFRVRIGPYGNKAEAEKFLGWIQTLPDYSGGYISELSVTRTR